MHFGTSKTQVYYHLLDLDDSQKQQCLEHLQQSQPELYRQVAALLAGESEDEPFSQLLGFGAHHAMIRDIDLSGEVVSKYHLTHELGRGGMGVVYAAKRADKTFEQDLAIKFIQSDLSNVLGQRALFDEAQLLARLNHPYIAKVFDGGLHGDSVYIVMERVFGQTLGDYLTTTAVKDDDKLRLFKQICQAVEHAHRHQVLHADLKPENILIDRNLRPKLLDFNLTQKAQTGKEDSPGTLIAFSQHYASPEQQAGKHLSEQSDVYSLGKILALMFPRPPVWSDVYWVIRRATRPASQQRYTSAQEFANDIQRMLERRPVEQKKHWPLYSALRLIQRRPLPALLTLTLLVSGLLFGQTLVVKNAQLHQEKKVAEDMMYEVTRLMFHAKGENAEHMSVNTMLELTRRRILSNPDIPKHIKQKMLIAMMTPVPESPPGQTSGCQPDCAPYNRIKP
ncbi:serine/threonine-protein kinase [Vibrio sp. CAU 1672]|uniref:serine/threonine-protein kinase n=1 Tax=Vibrio sp. CAU 1672 TaxID=3032594 RepID=UPI0023DA4990|nr:serine/threonine-protein kinase [Vibrio sp. CAU 1672]MDF2154049.1 serine/threonine-protein kinase [Vibrio sp. CAU 1672]